MTAGATIKLRRDTTAAWAEANPVLADGEPGLDTTTGLVKYGNGISTWNSLPYPGVDPATTMSARGSDPNNWNTMTQMGVYLVNRDSWAGTSNTPTDSLVFDGLVQVENVDDVYISQVFYPAAVDVSDAIVQWNRSYNSAVWTAWYKIVNNEQVINGGAY
jgi:hypothetical protein